MNLAASCTRRGAAALTIWPKWCVLRMSNIEQSPEGTRNILLLHSCLVFYGPLETFETPAERAFFAGAFAGHGVRKDLGLTPSVEVPFSVGGTSRKAIDYVLHVELGGLTEVIAPVIGKQPPTTTSGSLKVLFRRSSARRVGCTRVDLSGASNKSARRSRIRFNA
jgi:hypothetical protein